ncbi:hypothetical protein ACWA7J_00435 [Leptothrix sp. BB-4]
MASASRDRVTVDLRGIGDAVRSVAAVRRVTIATLAREALVAVIEAEGRGDAPPNPASSGHRDRTYKLTLRLPASDAAHLMWLSGRLGLSYGDLVARLVRDRPLPQPVKDRTADRAALLASNDALAALSADLNSFVRLVRRAQRAEAEPFAQRLRKMDTEVQSHLERVTKLLSGL